MKTSTTLVLLAITLLSVTSCSKFSAHNEPSVSSASATRWKNVAWWRMFKNSALNDDVKIALKHNQELRTIALRIKAADAVVANARAATQPHFNLGFGYDTGRKRAVDFGPYDLAPWRSSAQLGWELDLSNKLRTATRSARQNRNATIYDLHAARLMLASRVASVRFNMIRFNAEIELLTQVHKRSNKSTALLREKLNAGLIPSTELNRQLAEEQRFLRQKIEMERLRDLSIVQLRTLRGGKSASQLSQNSLPSLVEFPNSTLKQVLAHHPAILAAEARVRSAFSLQQSARLNLLPSLKLNAGLGGRQTALTNRYRTWVASIGPSLDIPVYDPTRIAALKSRRAAAQIAASQYRAAVLQALEEIDSARINLSSRRKQLVITQREVTALETTRSQIQQQYQAGLISQNSLLSSERDWLQSRRKLISLRNEYLNNLLDFVRATGGY